MQYKLPEVSYIGNIVGAEGVRPDPKKIDNPVISFFEPAKVKNVVGLSAICPFMNVTEPVCCNDDQV